MSEKLTAEECEEIRRIEAWTGASDLPPSQMKYWCVLLLRALDERTAERDALITERDTASHFLMCETHRANKFFYSCVDCVNRAITMTRTLRAERDRLRAAGQSVIAKNTHLQGPEAFAKPDEWIVVTRQAFDALRASLPPSEETR